MKWLSSIRHAREGSLVLERMELDEDGFPQPTGQLEELEADSLVLALGQEADLSLLEGVPGLEVQDGVVKVAPNMMTGYEGIFAGGDMVPAERTVTVGVGHGKRAAHEIDAWLGGQAADRPAKHPPVDFGMLNLWYFGDAAPRRQPELTPAQRVADFAEVVGGLSAASVSNRPVGCGNPDSSSSITSTWSCSPSNAVMVRSQLIRTPSRSASWASSSWAGIWSRVRR